MSKDIKLHLKEARNAIKNKENKLAIKLCKDVLKLDNKNYMAMVLLGAAYQDTDKIEAAIYLKQAIQHSSEPTLALQGLINCAESKDLPNVYRQLLKLTPEKYEDLHGKIQNLSKNLTELNECIEILQDEIQLVSSDENCQRIKSAATILSQLYLRGRVGGQFDEKWLGLFTNAIEMTLNSEPTNEFYELFKSQLSLLHKLGEIERLVVTAIQMVEKYPSDPYPLEWFAKAFVENYTHKVFTGIDVEIYVNELIGLNGKSLLGLAAYGIHLYLNGNFVHAKEVLEQVNKMKSNWGACLKILGPIYSKLNAFLMAEMVYRQLKTGDYSFSICTSMIDQEDQSKITEAIKLCKELIPKATGTNQNVLIYYLSKALILNEQFDIADKTIEKLKSMDNVDLNDSIYLSALKCRYTKDNKNAVDLLNTIPIEDRLTKHLLELGRNYMSIENVDEALSSFLYATKLDPSNSVCFYWLGVLYANGNDEVRARKCLEKCLNLNIMHKEAIILLGSIYRRQNENELHRKLLENLIASIIDDGGGEKVWALRQLGAVYLATLNYGEAINAFRSILKYDATDLKGWEGLADAYLSRGSFNSAMKVYQKIIELEPNNSYPKYQVGKINMTLMMYTEAIECFQQILDVNRVYFPALVGIAESYYGVAQKLKKQQLFGSSRDHSQKSINWIVQAIKIKPAMSCLWRMLANNLDFTAMAPIKYAFLNLPGSLAGVEELEVRLTGEKLFELAGKCYCRAIKLNQNDSLLWYGMAANYYNRAMKYCQVDDIRTRKEYLEMAAATIKNAIKLNANKWMYWSLLGVISATKEINNLQLAQHCFIKAVTIDKKSYTSWTNLGVLYLTQSEIKLANKTFTISQQSDPNYLNAWAGQAMIAELLAEVDEALDLFRHCTQLGFHPESGIGYAHWVCTILNTPENLDDPKYKYAIENMFAVPIALDSMEWYCNGDDHDVSSVESLSFLGYLSCRQGLWMCAVRAYEMASKKATGKLKDQILCNLGYALLKVNQAKEAAKAFHAVTEATYKSTIGLALALFKAAEYQDSYAVYESALQWLAGSDNQKSYILIAMSAMVYAFQGADNAKTVLFQCISLSSPPIEGLYSACALGILHNDLQLSGLVLQEFKKYENNPKFCHHIAFLKSQILLKNENKNVALRYLLSRVHTMPNHPILRKVLANFLLKNFTNSDKYSKFTSRIAQSSIALDLNITGKNTSMDAAKSFAMASEAMKNVDQKERKILAQKAIHMNPSSKEAWGALISCLG